VRECDAQFLASIHDVFIHPYPIRVRKPFCQGYALGWCLGMQFKAQPGIFDAVFLLQRIDNALADITEWSDIVGKDFHLNDHYAYSLQSEV